MPWQQFTIAMTDALAWPIVVFLLLVKLRRPLSTMATALADQARKRKLTKLGVGRDGLVLEFEVEGEWTAWPTLPIELEPLEPD